MNDRPHKPRPLDLCERLSLWWSRVKFAWISIPQYLRPAAAILLVALVLSLL